MNNSVRLSDLPNIGVKLEQLLYKVGITTPKELKKVGSIHACKRLEKLGEACLSKLYALEGAIRGVRWHHLPQEERTRLKNEFGPINNE